MTASNQLTLLNSALNPTIVSVPLPGGTGAPAGTTLQNQMVTALNKIVWNTYAIAGNTWQLTAELATTNNGGTSKSQTGLFAQGGWISGGIPGVDSVPLASGGLGMPGEFVVRTEIAQPNKAWLDDFNRTGRVPIPTISAQSFRGGNDNELVGEVRALRKEVEQLRKENNSGNVAIANTTSRGMAVAAETIVGAVETSAKKNETAIRMAFRNQRATN